MRPRITEIILRKCLRWRSRETVLVVTDAAFESTARGFEDAARAAGAEVILVSMPALRHHGQEPPLPVAEALKTCPVAILLTSRSMTHTMARREACEAHGVRIASMPGIDITRLEHLLDIDYDLLRKRNAELAGFFTGARRVRITSPAGTDLTFDITGREVHQDDGDLSRPGAFGNLPPGEVCIAAVENSAEGIVVIDGSITQVGLIKEPTSVRFSGGRLVEVAHDGLRRLLEPHGEEALMMGAFGIGTNPRASIVGNTLEDVKATGTVHVSFGANHSLGGRIRVPVNHAAFLSSASVEIDGKAVPRKFLTPLATVAVPDLTGLDVAAADTYKVLFESSNDPQLVLDLDTQRYLEVNTAFEELTEYSREELLSGAVSFSSIVARESLATYVSKRENRRARPAERYELRLQTKSGAKKAVELSVRLVSFSGREIVLVAIRDLTQRKKLEQEMWDKIEELGRANSRIYALTEKIRRVPELTPLLLHLTDEEELLERAAQLLCSRDGLGYADVSFHLLKGDTLVPAYSTLKGRTPARRRKLKAGEENRLLRVLRGKEPGGMIKKEAVLALKGREHNLGVMELYFDPKELDVLADNERARKGYQDLLETLANLIGLLVENLHLYDRVKRQAIVDHLTGAYNRRYFDAKLAEEVGRASRYGRDLSLLLIDLDHFKEINDTMSYKQGDLVLSETARLFRRHCREVDLVCRYGGDEFVILMPETNYDNAMAKARKLLEATRKTDLPNSLDPDKPVRVTLSIGVTSFHGGMKTGDDFLRAADEAVHAAKRGGRNRVFGVNKKAKVRRT